ncbi:peptidoglycan editing factor PgeF [Mesobacillus maritimus]|uniref:peptidoglycan editing factor PgeF n=1 Tax=Mesobacillus maritimus TaxID=1643336 RepID=UPI00203D156D|nr:peptidoglycan editing factor PgeF [Mesobacillus maritimus]MCM3587107.1 peptidoglycan editing factor PgeF [Mesobacillus maritimus]MCM3667672.1 peptidoglycan editing factor PgeF [Mesobacillus maritimus]
MEPFKIKDQRYFTINSWAEEFPNLVAGFTTKMDGVSEGEFSGLNFGFHVGDQLTSVCENRELLATTLGFPTSCWVGAEQTHEVHLEKVTKADKGKGASSYESSFSRTDGFFTDEAGILLTLCFADCVPIFFLDQESRRIGIAHAGWKGSVQAIAAEVVTAFKENGSNPSRILAIIGPSICKKCYIVDNRVKNLVEKALEGVEKKPYNQINDNEYSLDLKELNKQILIRAGVPEENILQTNYCTSCHQEYFYSHRRDCGSTGRMLAFIGWKEELRS